ncbi:MAG: HAD-IIA family hydrolase [Candidatus Heimdallarchaeota archaeon]|nr:HAD-IIA family hydrolase [Candidatus Heimdallarchaeota archaeon]
MVFDLREKTHIIMDCDGVLWKGNQPISGVIEKLEQLEQQGFKLGFVTNNSSLSREGFSQKFQNLGFNSENFTILNSGYGAAVHLRENSLTNVFMIGEAGLKEELESQGLTVRETYRNDLQAVCIGWDRDLTWAKLADGMWVILKNRGLFLATNPDNSFPFEDRLVPGAGAGIAALANACGKEPDIMIGKPSPYLLNLAMKEMACEDPSKAVFIGDRLSTDIKAGINAHMDTILVQTGITDHHLKKTILPTYTLESLAKIDTLI